MTGPALVFIVTRDIEANTEVANKYPFDKLCKPSEPLPVGWAPEDESQSGTDRDSDSGSASNHSTRKSHRRRHHRDARSWQNDRVPLSPTAENDDEADDSEIATKRTKTDSGACTHVYSQPNWCKCFAHTSMHNFSKIERDTYSLDTCQDGVSRCLASCPLHTIRQVSPRRQQVHTCTG